MFNSVKTVCPRIWQANFDGVVQISILNTISSFAQWQNAPKYQLTTDILL